MAKIVVGFLDSLWEAQGIVEDLARSGFERETISLAKDEGDLATPKMGARMGSGGVADDLTLFGVPEKHAQYYAEGLRRGGVLVTVVCENVRAPLASEIMDRHGAIDIDKRASEWQRTGARGGAERKAEARPGASFGAEQEGGRVDIRAGQAPDVGGGQVEPRASRRQGSAGRSARSGEAQQPWSGRGEGQTRSAAEREAAFRDSTIDIQESRKEWDEGFLAPDDADFQQHFQSYYSQRGEDYRGFRDAYRYGATMSHYTSKDWQDVEKDIHRDWDKDHPGTWDKFREAIHYGWEKTHRH